MTVENRILGFSNFEQDRIEFFAINEKKKTLIHPVNMISIFHSILLILHNS